MIFTLTALPGHLVREIRATRGHNDFAAVSLAQDRRHHAGAAERIGQVWQRLSLSEGEYRCNEAEQ
jgi:hypothetical protein